MQLIASVAEYPPAKAKFAECLPKLNEMVEVEAEPFPLVARFAKTAIDVITWTP